MVKMNVRSQQRHPRMSRAPITPRTPSASAAFSIEHLNQLIQPTIEALGYELLGCEYQASQRHGLLRIYIDKASGVDVDDCAQASRQISDILSVDAMMKDRAYTLEVSSPGLDRPLFTLAHFQRFVGEKVDITMLTLCQGRRHFCGFLKRVQDQQATVEVDGQEYVLPFEMIKRARLQPNLTW